MIRIIRNHLVFGLLLSCTAACTIGTEVGNGNKPSKQPKSTPAQETSQVDSEQTDESASSNSPIAQSSSTELPEAAQAAGQQAPEIFSYLMAECATPFSEIQVGSYGFAATGDDFFAVSGINAKIRKVLHEKDTYSVEPHQADLGATISKNDQRHATTATCTVISIEPQFRMITVSIDSRIAIVSWKRSGTMPETKVNSITVTLDEQSYEIMPQPKK